MEQLDPKSVWLFFIRYLSTWFVLVIIFASYSIFTFGKMGVSLITLFKILLVVVLVSLVVLWLWARLTYKFYRYTLKENSFQKESGVIIKKYVTIPYDRIQNVDIYRGVAARLLGLSDLKVQTAGASGVATAEGKLPGLSQKTAEKLRDELIKRSQKMRADQGL